MSELRRWKIWEWMPIILNFGLGASLLWFASGLEDWNRDFNMIAAGISFGISFGAVLSMATALLRQRYRRKDEQRDKQEFEAQLKAFKTEIEASRDEFFYSVMAQAAREIERLTDGQISIRVDRDKEDKRLH
jgi:hypothetical protein